MKIKINWIERALTINILLLLMSFSIYAQHSINIDSLIVLFPDSSLAKNDIVDIGLSTNNKDSLYLTISNECNDTICMPRKVLLGWPQSICYVMFCVSDSALRDSSSLNGFKFEDKEEYHYYDYYWDIEGHVKFMKYVHETQRMNNKGGFYILPHTKERLVFPIYIKGKYIFVRYQGFANKDGVVYYLQMDTNSVYMP